MPVDAGQTKDVKLKVTPPIPPRPAGTRSARGSPAEDASATTDLGLNITGQTEARRPRAERDWCPTRRLCRATVLGARGDYIIPAPHPRRGGRTVGLGAERLEGHVSISKIDLTASRRTTTRKFRR